MEKNRESLSSKIWSLVLLALLISNGVFCIASLIQSRKGIEAATRQRMLDIVNCAAGSVNGDVLKRLKAEDQDKPGYRRVYDALAVYRDNVELKYVYGIRDEGNGVFTFTVDPSEENHAEFGQQVYYTDALYAASKGVASVCEEPYTDAWGRFYSAYSPVFGSDGNVAGIIACDFSVPWVEQQIGRQTVSTTLLYILVLALTLIAAGIFCYFQIRILVNPLKHMTKVAKRYEKGDFSEELTVTESVEEIDELSRSLQSMAVSLAEQIKKAEQANEAKTRFLAHMSHEIRTPINAVLGMNEMILRESNDEAILTYAETVDASGRTLLSLINDILDFSRIEAGKMEIRPVEYDLSYLVNDLVNMAKPKAEKKGLTLAVDLDRNTPAMLIGDEVRIRQILTNILSNALKYTEQGSITLGIGFSETGEPDSILLRVFVRDTGIGIKPADMEKLYVEFERIDEQKNHSIEGTGLGMSITRNLLERMGSCLMVESVWGEGSVFSFVLKQKVVKWEPIGSYEVAYRALRSGRRRYHVRFKSPESLILAVDDNATNLLVFKNLLKQTKVVIETAENGDEGMRMIREKKYDMIFLDHMMPGKDGIEILHETRREEENPNRETPVVCLTANAIAGMREEYISEGFDGYLAKPVDPARLEETLLSFLPEEKIVRVSENENTGEMGATGKEREAYEALKVLNDFPAIDPVAGLANSGSAKAYRSLLLLFYEEIDKNIRELTHFLENGELKDYRICIHSLKSSARVIGATMLGEEAQLLEDAAKNENADIINAHQENFLKAYAQFKEPLSKLFVEETDPQDKPLADAERLARVCEELRLAAEEMDCDWLDSVLKELDRFRIPKEGEEFFLKIRSAVARYDYEGVLSILSGGGQ